MEQRWIPVSERLPEKYGSYLVAWKPCNMSAAYVVKRSGAPHYYEILEYDPNDESGWIESIKQATGAYEILAWMPLPEPYRGGEQPKQTNADRIRSMTDEELAANMMCPNENGLAEIDCDKNDNCNCYECLLNWLRAESEEKHGE